MKKMILWLILIILLIFGGVIIYLKFFELLDSEKNNFNSDDISIETDKKILSTWISVKREKYINDDLVLDERYLVSLLLYEDTVDVCVGSGFNCEELEYKYEDDKISLYDGTLGFTGDFIKLSVNDDSVMELMQVDEEGNKYIYYFDKPAG